MKIIRTIIIIMLVMWACNGFGQTRDTIYIHDTVRMETLVPVVWKDSLFVPVDTGFVDYGIRIYMPSFYGGYVELKDSTSLYKAIFGVLPPLNDNVDLVPRVYQFMTVSGYRITLFRTGAWVRQKKVNGKWIIVPY